MANVQALQRQGWYLTPEGIEECKENGKDGVEDLIKAALDLDLKDIGEKHLQDGLSKSKVNHVDGPFVIQIQKIRNVTAPKDNEESQAAPKMFRLTLSDGYNSCTAIEIESISKLGLNTPPGTKLKLLGQVPLNHGFLLLNNSNCKVLGGRVEKMVDNWELKRALAKQSRANVGGEGGPPLFIPFGQRRRDDQPQQYARKDNFKSLDTSKEKKAEDKEFEQQRQAVIDKALQVKEGSRSKNFTSGAQKSVSDKDVAKIVEMGFSAEYATRALKENNNNVQEAINSLLHMSETKGRYGNERGAYGGDRGNYRGNYNDRGNFDDRGSYGDRSGYGGGDSRGRGRDSRDSRQEPHGEGGRGRGRRGRQDNEDFEDAPSKPSAPATLFDFLTKKIPSKESKSSGVAAVESSSKEDAKDQTHTEGRRSRNPSEGESGNKRGPQNLPPRLLKQQQKREEERQRHVSGGRTNVKDSSPESSQPPTQSSRPEPRALSSASAKSFDEQGDSQEYNSRQDFNRGQRQNDNRYQRQDDHRQYKQHDFRNQRQDDYRGQRQNDYRNQRSDNYRGARSDDYRNQRGDDYRGQRMEDYRGPRSNDYRGQKSDDYRGQRQDDFRGPRQGRGSQYNQDYNAQQRRPQYDSQNRGNMPGGPGRPQWSGQQDSGRRGDLDSNQSEKQSRGGGARDKEQVVRKQNYQNNRDYNAPKAQAVPAFSQRNNEVQENAKQGNTKDSAETSSSSSYSSHDQTKSPNYQGGSVQSAKSKATDFPSISQSSTASLASKSVLSASSSEFKSAVHPSVSSTMQPVSSNGTTYTQGLIPGQYDYQVATSVPLVVQGQSQMALNGDTAIISMQAPGQPIQAMMTSPQQAAPSSQYNIPNQVLQHFQGIQITGPPPVQTFALPSGPSLGSVSQAPGQPYVQQTVYATVNQSVPASIDYNNKQKYSIAKQMDSSRGTRLWKAGDYCAAKYYYENKYYRAIVQSSNPNGQTCLVLFPDYGNMEEVSVNDIKTIPYLAWEANNIQSPGLAPAMGMSQVALATMAVPVSISGGAAGVPGVIVQSPPAMPYAFTDQPYQGPYTNMEYSQATSLNYAANSTHHVALSNTNQGKG